MWLDMTGLDVTRGDWTSWCDWRSWCDWTGGDRPGRDFGLNVTGLNVTWEVWLDWTWLDWTKFDWVSPVTLYNLWGGTHKLHEKSIESNSWAKQKIKLGSVQSRSTICGGVPINCTKKVHRVKFIWIENIRKIINIIIIHHHRFHSYHFARGEGRGTLKRQFPAKANEWIPKRVFTSGRDKPVTMDGRLCWPPKMGHSVLRAMCTDMPKGTRGNQCNSQNIMVDRIMMHSTQRQLQRQLQSRWSKEIVFRRKRFPRHKPQRKYGYPCNQTTTTMRFLHSCDITQTFP